jgi:UDP-N-acetylmuramate dehydrogenase
VIGAGGEPGAPVDAALDPIGRSLGRRAWRDAPLGARTTYRVGGPAALFLEANEEEDLVALHRALATEGRPVPVLVLGEGSNLLVCDEGFPGVVVSLGAAFAGIDVAPPVVRAGGRTKLPVLARRSAAASLHGLEWAVGVPGSVGGALRMNAGGHGSDIAAVLRRFAVYDLRSGRVEESGPHRLALGYRRSSLDAGEVVLWAEFGLERGERTQAERAVADVVRWRRAHQPGGSNAGSVFVNPDGDSAGRLVEAAGLKGFRMGSAQVSDKHANFIQADPGGSAADVWALICHVRAEVAARTGVELALEVRPVGFGVAPPTVLAGGQPQAAGRGVEPSPSTGGRG